MLKLTFGSRFWTMVVGLVLVLTSAALFACAPADETLTSEVQSGAPPAVTPTVEEHTAVNLDPVAVTTAFYEWYLAYANPEAGHNPLVDGAYRDSEHLSAACIERVDARLAQMRAQDGGVGYDPFLMGQALPQGFTVEAWEEGSEEARVIVHQQFGERLHDLTLDLVREASRWKIECIRQGNPTTPDGVTRLFLYDYLEQAKASLQSGEPGILQSGAYRQSDLLSTTFIAKVDETAGGSAQGAYDPFLLAQDLPHALNFGEGVVTGDTATVMVGRYYAGTPEPTEMLVELGLIEGRWQIVDIRPLFEPEIGSEMSPEAVVEGFYAAWIEQVRAAMMGGAESPLRSGAYADSGYLTPAFSSEVASIVASFEGGGYDPFLCAQDIPTELITEGVIYTTSGARVPVRSSFIDHAFVVALVEGEGGWQIDNVVCPGAAQNNAAIFYTWYLAYTRDCCIMGMTDPGLMRNPLVDGAYRDAPYIDPAFAEAVAAELAEMRAAGGIGHDPILQAQAFPPDFSVELGEQEGIVIVDMHFANTHRLKVEMTHVIGQWLVSNVTRLEETSLSPIAQPDTSDWQIILDEDYGFRFQIPADWVAIRQDLEGPGMPDNWPVLRQYLVMPAAIAEQLANQGDQAGGNEPALVPPFSVSLLEGDQAAFDRVYVAADDIQTIHLNGRAIEVQRQGTGFVVPRYILREGERWLVVEDVVSEFPGREEQAGEVFGVLDGILATMAFDES